MNFKIYVVRILGFQERPIFLPTSAVGFYTQDEMSANWLAPTVRCILKTPGTLSGENI